MLLLFFIDKIKNLHQFSEKNLNKRALRTVVRGNFNIHGTKNFQDAVFHQKSKI